MAFTRHLTHWSVSVAKPPLATHPGNHPRQASSHFTSSELGHKESANNENCYPSPNWGGGKLLRRFAVTLYFPKAYGVLFPFSSVLFGVVY